MNRELALQVAQRASMRAATKVHGQMKRGLDSLPTIASTAAWLGAFATVMGIFNSFRGISGDRWSNYAAISRGLSESLVLTALGLLVALVAFWFYQHLLAEAETFDSEMQNASLDLVNNLGRLSAR